MFNTFLSFHCASRVRLHTLLPRNDRTTAFRGNRRGIRRQQYAQTQSLWAARPTDAARAALNGSWRYPRGASIPEGMEAFWSDLIRTPSIPDSRPGPSAGPQWDLLRPVSESDLRAALRAMRSSADGPDGLTAEDLLKSFAVSRTVVRLLQLYWPVQEELTTTRVVFLPKRPEPATPADFRPIAISSAFVRVPHKVVASRSVLSAGIPDTQFAVPAP